MVADSPLVVALFSACQTVLIPKMAKRAYLIPREGERKRGREREELYAKPAKELSSLPQSRKLARAASQYAGSSSIQSGGFRSRPYPKERSSGQCGETFSRSRSFTSSSLSVTNSIEEGRAEFLLLKRHFAPLSLRAASLASSIHDLREPAVARRPAKSLCTGFRKSSSFIFRDKCSGEALGREALFLHRFQLAPACIKCSREGTQRLSLQRHLAII